MKKILYQLIIMATASILVCSCQKNEIKNVVDYTFSATATLSDVEHNWPNIERHITLEISEEYTAEHLKMSYRINNNTTESILRNGEKVDTDDYILDTEVDKLFYFTYTPTEREDKTLKIILQNSKIKREISLLIPVTERVYYNVKLEADSGGTVEPAGEFSILEDSLLHITASAKDYYSFAYWENGYANPDREVIITSDTTFKAYFKEFDRYNIYLTATEGGQASSNKDSAYNTEKITITASANDHYRFVKWSDGNTDPVRDITVTSDISLQAIFEPVIYTITSSVSPAKSGNVSGSGEYPYNSTAILTATANTATGYAFEKWIIDATTSTDNPLKLQITGPHNIVAHFYKPITSLSVTHPTSSSKLLLSNKTVHISPMISPADATYKQLAWSSSDTSVATIDHNGDMTMKNVGYTTITANTTDGSNLTTSQRYKITDEIDGYIELASSFDEKTGIITYTAYFNADKEYPSYNLSLSGYIILATGKQLSLKINNGEFKNQKIGSLELDFYSIKPGEDIEIYVSTMSVRPSTGESFVTLSYNKNKNRIISNKE